jgi:nucleoside-diphosphate-sugar epimerase
VAKAMIMLADKNIFGERFIVSAENLTFKQILDMLADALDRPRPKYKLNEFFLSTAYILDQFRTLLTLSDPILTKENIKYINMNNRYSSQKLLNALPEFKFTPIKETIQLMAKIFINSLSDEEKKAKGSYIKALKSIID